MHSRTKVIAFMTLVFFPLGTMADSLADSLACYSSVVYRSKQGLGQTFSASLETDASPLTMIPDAVPAKKGFYVYSEHGAQFCKLPKKPNYELSDKSQVYLLQLKGKPSGILEYRAQPAVPSVNVEFSRLDQRPQGQKIGTCEPALDAKAKRILAADIKLRLNSVAAHYADKLEALKKIKRPQDLAREIDTGGYLNALNTCAQIAPKEAKVQRDRILAIAPDQPASTSSPQTPAATK